MAVSVGNGLRGEITLQAKRREGLLSRNQSSVRGRGAVASRPWGERVLGAGRSNRGRGAMKIKEEETTFLLKRTTFKEKKTGVVFGCFCWKRGGRGDNFADEKPTDFLPTNLTNFHEFNEEDGCMSCSVVPSRHIVLASLFRGLRPRLPSLRSVVPSRHLTQVTKTLKMFEFV